MCGRAALGGVGFTHYRFFSMDTAKKLAGFVRRFYRTACAEPKGYRRRRGERPLPGPLFDATVFGLFVVFAIVYFV